MKIKTVMAILLIMTILLTIPYLCLRDIPSVQTVHLKKIEYCRELEFTGNIEAESYTPMKLSYPVFIKESYVLENSYVNKGQLMFVLDVEKMTETLKNSDLSAYSAVDGFMDKSYLMNLSENIYATDSGIVKELTAYDGSIVMAEENLCIIENTDELLLKITLAQENYTDVSMGDKVEFSSVIAPSRKYKGTVLGKTAVVRKETSLTGSKTVVDVFASVENPDEYIISGLEVTGKAKKEKMEIYTLPYEYIGQDENGEYAVIYSEGKKEKVYIETGVETEKEVEIVTAFPQDTMFIKNEHTDRERLLLKHDF